MSHKCRAFGIVIINCSGPVASGTIQRIKKTYLTRPLTGDMARNLGLDLYYAPCRRAFDGILKALDREVIRPLMANVVQYSGKELEEMLRLHICTVIHFFRNYFFAIFSAIEAEESKCEESNQEATTESSQPL